MKKNNTIFLSFLFCISLTLHSSAQTREINFHHGSFDELLSSAKKANKIIFVDCFTTWCGPCKWMSKNVFTNDTVADFYNKNFINAKIDMEKGEGLQLAEKYQIHNYPTMLYLDANGNQLHRICGSSSPVEFIRHAEEAMNPETQLKTLSKNFNKGKVPAEAAVKYFSKLHQACQSMQKELEQYFSFVNQPEMSTEMNWEIIQKYISDPNSKAFKAVESDKNNFVDLYGQEVVESKIEKVYTAGLDDAVRKKDNSEFESLKEKLRNTKAENAEQIILKAEIEQSEITGDWNEYASKVNRLLTDFDSENANALNRYAWTFYEKVEDKMMLSKAETWAKKACELTSNYANTDTYAAILFKLGKKSEAKKIAESAIQLAKEGNEDASETEALLVKINALQ